MARPIIFEKSRERAVGENATLGLAARAIVGLVVGVADALNGGAADRAGLTEAAVDGHARTERSDLLRKTIAGLGPEPLDPFDEDLTRGRVESLGIGSCSVSAREPRGDSRARWRISSE